MSFEIKKPSIFGDKNPHWKGGRITKRDGRVMIRSWESGTSEKYVYRYRAVMETLLGRKLTSGEVVHHINGDPSDDRLENLELMSSRNHNILHALHLQRNGLWSRNHPSCLGCGTTEVKHKGHGLCTRCSDRKRWPIRRASK